MLHFNIFPKNENVKLGLVRISCDSSLHRYPQPVCPMERNHGLRRIQTNVSGGSKGGARDARPPGPKFLHFHAVFGQIGQIIGWRPPPPLGLAPPPLGNPGSATECDNHIEVAKDQACFTYMRVYFIKFIQNLIRIFFCGFKVYVKSELYCLA